jgi:hypothetical protein
MAPRDRDLLQGAADAADATPAPSADRTNANPDQTAQGASAARSP